MALLHILLMFKCLVLLVWLQQLASAEVLSPAGGVTMVKKGCQPLCGNVSIPYPFGIGLGCYMEKGFEIKCDDGKPKTDSFSNIRDISVLRGEITVDIPAAKVCASEPFRLSFQNATLGQFRLSNRKNKLVLHGCDAYAYINGNVPIFIENCLTCVNSIPTGGSTSSSVYCGKQCCETSIPDAGLAEYTVSVVSQPPKNKSTGDIINYGIDDKPCSYAFITEKNSSWDRYFGGKVNDTINSGNENFPVVLDWTVPFKDGSKTCQCGPHTACVGSDDGLDYRCFCLRGAFEGNPYLNKTTGGDYCKAVDTGESFPRTKFNKVVAGACLSLSILLVTSYVLGI